MTAEVAVYNTEAIVVAADSAMTVGGKRVWEFGNKIFSMGPSHTLGIMYYNNADLGGIPLETLIKIFKRKNRGTSFTSVQDFAEEFIGFAQNQITYSIQDDQEAVTLLCLHMWNEIFVDVAEIDEYEDGGEDGGNSIRITPNSISTFIDQTSGDVELNKLSSIIEIAEQIREPIEEYLRELMAEEL